MVWGLPDLKSALQSALTNFYTEHLQNALESKSNEYKTLLQANFAYSRRTQQALIAICFALLCILAIAYFWK